MISGKQNRCLVSQLLEGETAVARPIRRSESGTNYQRA